MCLNEFVSQSECLSVNVSLLMCLYGIANQLPACLSLVVAEYLAIQQLF